MGKIAISDSPKCPHCGCDGFDDWWHDKTTRYVGDILTARVKCHGCGKFFSTKQYPDGVNHSSAGFK